MLGAMTLRWGFLGPGRIAATVAADLALLEDATPLAVAGRDFGRAREFAAANGFERAYGSYAELLADPDVDAVYVATPHAQHHAVTSAVIAAGKPVLVEKAFTCTLAAATDLVEQARAAGVFVMEAMWTRFVPNVVRLRELIADGAVGEVRQVHADLGLVGPQDPGNRLWDPAQGGGAMLDLGVYPVSFAQMVLGAPASVQARGSLAATGVDAESGLLLSYADGRVALLSCSLLAASPGRAMVVGTGGCILVEPRFHHPPCLVLQRDGREDEVVERAPTGRGYAHQLQEVARCVRAGIAESPVMPLADTLSVMAVMDEALDQLGGVHRDEGFPA